MSLPDPPVTAAGGGSPDPPTAWFRRRGVLVIAVIAAVLVVTVLSDLPVPTSRANDVSSERGVMSQLNTDLAPCALAVHQAIGIWDLEATHQLSAADRSGTPGLLSDDQGACSLTNEYVFDLTNIEVPGSPAGKDMGQLVATATTWTTSDALGAIEAVQVLMHDPSNAGARQHLALFESHLASDRRLARAEEAAADTALSTQLPAADMPAEPRTPPA